MRGPLSLVLSGVWPCRLVDALLESVDIALGCFPVLCLPVLSPLLIEFGSFCPVCPRPELVQVPLPSHVPGSRQRIPGVTQGFCFLSHPYASVRGRVGTIPVWACVLQPLSQVLTHDASIYTFACAVHSRLLGVSPPAAGSLSPSHPCTPPCVYQTHNVGRCGHSSAWRSGIGGFRRT